MDTREPIPVRNPLSPQNLTVALDVYERGRDSPLSFAPNRESEQWINDWQTKKAIDLVDVDVVEVEANTTVEEACELLLARNVPCLTVRNEVIEPGRSTFSGLFDFADVNAFLMLAATQHTLSEMELQENPRLHAIVKAAKAGHVPVGLISDLSEKNPLEVLGDGATIVDLLTVFGTGTHRVLLQSSINGKTSSNLGFVTDRSLLSFFYSAAQSSPAPGLSLFLSNPLHSLSLPSLSLRADVMVCGSNDTVLDAMRMMSEGGVSSVAVSRAEDDVGQGGNVLLSAVSVTDVGNMVVPSQSKQILHMPLQQFVSQIKEPHGSTDGEDRYPVYSVSAASTLRYTIEKLLATNAHRVFITEELRSADEYSPIMSTPPQLLQSPLGGGSGNTTGPQLRGVVSVVDILSLFARLAGLPDIDPRRMQRHRRASSTSTSATAGNSPQLTAASPRPIPGL